MFVYTFVPIFTPMKKAAYIVYYETPEQTDDQKEAAQKFLGYRGYILSEYIEFEKDKRPGLKDAIKAAQRNEAGLLITQTNSLLHRSNLLVMLYEANIDIVCADIPGFDRKAIGILAFVAQQKKNLISQKTKEALRAKKAQGYILGNPQNFTNESRKKGARARKEKARKNPLNQQVTTRIMKVRKEGLSFRKIAEMLHREGYKTVQGKEFRAATVKMLHDREIGEIEAPMQIRRELIMYYKKEGMTAAQIGAKFHQMRIKTPEGKIFTTKKIQQLMEEAEKNG